MNRDEVIEKIKKDISFVTVIDIQKLENDKSLRKDYMIDYLELDEILCGIEERFDVSLFTEGYEKLDTINDITNVILNKALNG